MAEKTSPKQPQGSAPRATTREKAADDAHWRQFLIDLLVDVLHCPDREHAGAAVVARHAQHQFPEDEEVTRLTTAVLGAGIIH